MWYSSGLNIYDKRDKHIATIVNGNYEVAHRMAASNELAAALEQWERIGFGSSATDKQIKAAVEQSQQALNKLRGKFSEHKN